MWCCLPGRALFYELHPLPLLRYFVPLQKTLTLIVIPSKKARDPCSGYEASPEHVGFITSVSLGLWIHFPSLKLVELEEIMRRVCVECVML